MNLVLILKSCFNAVFSKKFSFYIATDPSLVVFIKSRNEVEGLSHQVINSGYENVEARFQSFSGVIIGKRRNFFSKKCKLSFHFVEFLSKINNFFLEEEIDAQTMRLIGAFTISLKCCCAYFS